MKTEGNILAMDVRSWQRGLTLIEIMVALLIGSFLLAGVLQIFIVNKQTYRVQENLSRMQENGRFAIDYLSRYIRLAGSLSGEVVDETSSKESHFKYPTTAVRGANQSGLNGSDTVTVRFYANSYAGMTDCLGNEINSGNGKTIATNQFLIQLDTNNIDPNTNLPRSALYCDPQHSDKTDPNRQPLVENVENMQIRYCVPVGGGNRTACIPVDDTWILEWNSIKSIKVSLLLRSADDNLVSQPQPYQFDVNGDGVLDTAEKSITPNDRRLRRVFTTTIMLRNM